MKKRILFYYTHKEDLGHTVRILNIINALKKKYKNQVELFVFQGGKSQKFLNIPNGIEWFNLPYPFYSKLNFKVPIKISTLSKIKLRINYMLSKIKKIKPHIFITEFFPFGRLECKYELLPLFEKLIGMKTKIFASIAYPYFINHPDSFLHLCKYYCKIFIHTPKKLETVYFYHFIEKEGHTSKKEYIELFNKKLKGKIIYTGYILPVDVEDIAENDALSIRRQFNAENKIFVLVSRGGGAFYPKIITHSILAKKYLDNKYVFLVIAGPSTSKKEMNLFKKCIEEVENNNIYLKKYVNNLYKFLKIADICISTSGYNTSIELLYFKKKSILIPFIGYSKNSIHIEQLSHAQMLKDKINSSILNYSALSPLLIAEEIKNKFNQKINSCKYINKNWFKGAEITSEIIMNI